MDKLRLKPREGFVGCEQPITIAERELRSFVGSVIDLFGSEGAKFLEDIWLDELAEMELTPEPTSPQWRLVSIAASSRLADTFRASIPPAALMPFRKSSTIHKVRSGESR